MTQRDPLTTYRRIIEDLERIAATIPSERLDVTLWSEIKEAKEELSKQGYVYLDGYERPFRPVPAIRKCPRCGKTKGLQSVNECCCCCC
jgi:hypothetical protein